LAEIQKNADPSATQAKKMPPRVNAPVTVPVV